MTIKVGDTLPSGTFTIMTPSGPAPLTTSDLFSKKKVALFSVPGAFTPTCSNEHLPGFKSKSSALKEKGIDTIACMAVNDVFVMDAWGKERGVKDEMLMLADGNGEYTKALGLELDVTKFGLGMRGQRFSMVVNDGVVEQLNIDPEGFQLSSAECMLNQL
mmetsp:Transcript_24301/g.51282  ORF Transcript_24301/g.51282 Transcript_24301/m.51282 type:complete len:160 (-) Transcript_24301:208-687(-)|eukprot:CAMPEP_0171341310 /NCGR_PEP_ID=MMETSP0878-20121228/9991_1 /TAXON_ID=67004 /ORGANISM="Thalassiosira weissflogii, Strain CCMP1336" /LENGTH=159 /DNA_ID=CAMNT_0011843513 /DNA_START=60 /DNA_END=539 /DNA_ORIENTATION=+